MGTRCITTVRSRWDGNEANEWVTHATVYRHFDGYLSEHGAWLHDFLDGLEVVNGRGGNMPARYANGPGELAALLTAKLLKDGHCPSLVPENRNCGQEFHYFLDVLFGLDGGKVTVRVLDGPMTFFGAGGEECVREIFQGTVEEYGEFIAKEREDGV